MQVLEAVLVVVVDTLEVEKVVLEEEARVGMPSVWLDK